ncbi:MAG: TonB-dependent receptor [Candidatus Delongbacteria bacterium]|nr:TonB-dependent receptor [Candidatus Delongbacteria bacterium]
MKRSIVILMIALFSSMLFSGTTGKIKGIATDENGEPLEGANIMVVGKTWGAETDEDGYYYIIGVRAGTYQVKCQYIGYSPKTITNLKVRVGLTSSQNFKLISEAIEIDELEIEIFQDEKVEMDVTTSIRNVDMGTMETQALTEVGDVLGSQAGIKKDSDGELHFRGGRSGEVNYVIDGISVGDPTGAKAEPVSINFANVESFNIQKGIPDAEYGDALSGSVNIVMKIGDQETTSGHAKYSTDTFLGENRLNYTRGEFSLSGPIPIPGMKEKPTYYIGTDFTTQNGFGSTYRELGDVDGDYFEYGDYDLTGLGFEVGQGRQNDFNVIFKTAYQITPMISLSTSYTKSRSHNYDFNWLYRYTPQTATESIMDVTIFNVNFKQTLNQQSYYDFIFSYYNREYESLPGGKYPNEFVYEDSLDWFNRGIGAATESDVLANFVRDGGDAEGYVDGFYGGFLDGNNQINYVVNGYFDREYFEDANGNSNFDADVQAEYDSWIDANNNGTYDGDYLYDSNKNNQWDYWEIGQSFSGFVSDGSMGIFTDHIVEGYQDQNLSGHYDKNIYGVASDEPFIDGDKFQETGEPFVDHKRFYIENGAIVKFSNNYWDEGEVVVLNASDLDSADFDYAYPSLWSELEDIESNDLYNADVLINIDSTRVTITYPQENFADLRSSLGSSTQTTPRFNDVYNPQDGMFDEFEAYCARRQYGSSTNIDDLGWTAGHGPLDNPTDYYEYIGSYVVYRTSADMYSNIPGYYQDSEDGLGDNIPKDEYSTWLDLNNDGFLDIENGLYDSGERYVDYNYNGVRNDNSGFLLPDSYLDGMTYQNFNNTVMKFKGNYTNQINKFHMIKTGFELALNDFDYYSLSNPFVNYIDDDGAVIDGDPYPAYGDQKTSYDYSPTEFSMYVQDKMEFEDLVVNAGIRLDIRTLDQAAVDYYNDQQDEEEVGYEEELDQTIFAISPRFGISHSISETSKLFFSYGHLYQKPTYTQVFAPNTAADVANPLFGNMNLGYQRNVQYELGVVNELGLYLIDITGYFKDIYDMINTKQIEDPVEPVTIYYNSDYGKSRGVEVSVDRSLKDHYLWGLSYTLSYAYGKSSDEESNMFEDAVEVKEFPLNWDERHSLSTYFTLLFGRGETLFDLPYTDNWSFGLNTSFGSGYPFTPTTDYYRPEIVAEKDIETNSERMPWTSNTDIKFSKTFAFSGENNVSYGNLKFEFNVYNVFNKINVFEVHTDTGSWWRRSEAYYEDDQNSNFAEVNANPARIAERRHYKFGVSYAW